jgi:hypothetical protein
MAKLVNLIPGREIVKEDLEDMDVSLPGKVERFLDRAIQVVKSYNLSRRKEQMVIAKIIDALGMTPSELQQAVTKLKKYKIVKR